MAQRPLLRSEVGARACTRPTRTRKTSVFLQVRQRQIQQFPLREVSGSAVAIFCTKNKFPTTQQAQNRCRNKLLHSTPSLHMKDESGVSQGPISPYIYTMGVYTGVTLSSHAKQLIWQQPQPRHNRLHTTRRLTQVPCTTRARSYLVSRLVTYAPCTMHKRAPNSSPRPASAEHERTNTIQDYTEESAAG